MKLVKTQELSLNQSLRHPTNHYAVLLCTVKVGRWTNIGGTPEQDKLVSTSADGQCYSFSPHLYHCHCHSSHLHADFLASSIPLFSHQPRWQVLCFSAYRASKKDQMVQRKNLDWKDWINTWRKRKNKRKKARKEGRRDRRKEGRPLNSQKM